MKCAASALKRGIVVMACLIGSALPVLAQGVGAIGGTVIDSTGGALPGATVILSSEQERSAAARKR